MKTTISIITALCCIAITSLAGQIQHIAPGEMPEGLSVEDWGIVQKVYLEGKVNTRG